MARTSHAQRRRRFLQRLAEEEAKAKGLERDEQNKIAERLMEEYLANLVRCAICLESRNFVRLPCCEGEDRYFWDRPVESTTRFCLECLQQLAAVREARCPKCRTAWLGVSETEVVVTRGLCEVCQADNVYLPEPNTCGHCVFGRKHAIRYECLRCHRLQRIPHPLYRAQRIPETFSYATWRCQRCNDDTIWRAYDRPPLKDDPWPERDFKAPNLRLGETGFIILCCSLAFVFLWWLYSEESAPGLLVTFFVTNSSLGHIIYDILFFQPPPPPCPPGFRKFDDHNYGYNIMPNNINDPPPKRPYEQPRFKKPRWYEAKNHNNTKGRSARNTMIYNMTGRRSAQ